MLILPSEWKKDFSNDKAAFDTFFNMKGEIFRHHKNRTTLRFLYLNKAYFIKIHEGVGYKEIIKNMFSLKKTVLGAENEWLALQKLNMLAIPTIEAIGYGKRGWNPAAQHSFLITEALEPHIDLAQLFSSWNLDKSYFSLKRELIKKVAMLAKTLHENGINHRDFYLCHFVVKVDSPITKDSVIYLMDLHRAQIRKSVPTRWLIKDLAGLYFSAMEINLSLRDCFWFLKHYKNKKIKDIILKEKSLWSCVNKKARALYVKTL